MYKYIFFTILILFCSSTYLKSQETEAPIERQHILHLKNGSSIIGVLIEYSEGFPAIIEVGDGQRLSIPRESILRLEPVTQRKAKSLIRKSKIEPYSFKETGWHYSGNLGAISPGSSVTDDKVNLAIDVNAVYHFSRILGIGASVGYESYEKNNLNNLVPVQLVVQGYLSSKPTSLFYSVATGYSFSLSDTEDNEWQIINRSGGVSFYPKVGARFSGHRGANTVVFAGIKIQKASLESRWGEDFEESIIQERTFKRLIIGLGIVF